MIKNWPVDVFRPGLPSNMFNLKQNDNKDVYKAILKCKIVLFELHVVVSAGTISMMFSEQFFYIISYFVHHADNRMLDFKNDSTAFEDICFKYC